MQLQDQLLRAGPRRPLDTSVEPGEELPCRRFEEDLQRQGGLKRREPSELLIARDLGAALRAQQERDFILRERAALPMDAQLIL